MLFKQQKNFIKFIKFILSNLAQTSPNFRLCFIKRTHRMTWIKGLCSLNRGVLHEFVFAFLNGFLRSSAKQNEIFNNGILTANNLKPSYLCSFLQVLSRNQIFISTMTLHFEHRFFRIPKHNLQQILFIFFFIFIENCNQRPN